MHDSLIYPPANVARKSGLTLAAHWLSALAVGLAIGLVWLRESLDDDAQAARLLAWHRQLGLLVLLLLACARLTDTSMRELRATGARLTAHAVKDQG